MADDRAALATRGEHELDGQAVEGGVVAFNDDDDEDYQDRVKELRGEEGDERGVKSKGRDLLGNPDPGSRPKPKYPVGMIRFHNCSRTPVHVIFATDADTLSTYEMDVTDQNEQQDTTSLAGRVGGSSTGPYGEAEGKHEHIKHTTSVATRKLKVNPDAVSKIEKPAYLVRSGERRWVTLDPVNGDFRCLTILADYAESATECKVVAGIGERIRAQQKYVLTKKQVQEAEIHSLAHIPDELKDILRQSVRF